MLESSPSIAAQRAFTHLDQRLDDLAPQIVETVSAQLGLRPPHPDHEWPADLVQALREFVFCVATDHFERILAPHGIFEQIGVESARAGIAFEVVAEGTRKGARLVQFEMHRSMLECGAALEADETMDLLGRVLEAGDAVIETARRGHERAWRARGQEGELERRLATEMIVGGEAVAALVAEMGWAPAALVCAVVTDPGEGARIADAAPTRVALHPRSGDVVLGLPLPSGHPSTDLRPLLEGVDCAVGPAVPLAEFADSLALAGRAGRLLGGRSGATFVDDHLLRLACTADEQVVRALQRKHFGGLGGLDDEMRDDLLSTLHEWLLRWGHRPGVAEALYVHPQTVSGRIARLKDLLDDDLTDPQVRSELLVLLSATR